MLTFSLYMIWCVANSIVVDGWLLHCMHSSQLWFVSLSRRREINWCISIINTLHCVARTLNLSTINMMIGVGLLGSSSCMFYFWPGQGSHHHHSTKIHVLFSSNVHQTALPDLIPYAVGSELSWILLQSPRQQEETAVTLWLAPQLQSLPQ